MRGEDHGGGVQSYPKVEVREHRMVEDGVQLRGHCEEMGALFHLAYLQRRERIEQRRGHHHRHAYHQLLHQPNGQPSGEIERKQLEGEDIQQG